MDMYEFSNGRVHFINSGGKGSNKNHCIAENNRYGYINSRSGITLTFTPGLLK